MSLIVLAVGMAAAAAAAGVSALVLRRRASKVAAAPGNEKGPLGPRFPLELGDVIELDGEELWLAEGWLLAEGSEPLAALLFCEPACVLVTPAPQPLVRRLSGATIDAVRKPEATLEHEGVIYDRARRVPVRVTPLARSRPAPFAEALFCEYRAPGERLWLLSAAGECLAWRARDRGPVAVERWGVVERD